jgi:TolB-like protein
VKERGYQVMSSEEIESFLFRYRIRNTGMLSRMYLSALRQEFAVGLVMVGSVDLFYESEENPQWGLSSRILSTESGAIRWAESTGFTGDDFTGMLGLGTIRSGEQLAEEVIQALLRDLPRAGDSFPVPEPSSPSTDAIYRSPVLDSDPPQRVAVLPFKNFSERKGAGRILTDVFTTALFQHGGFEVVEPGEVGEALLALKAPTYGTIDFEGLAEVRKRVGVDAVIVGTVYTYNEGIKRTETTAPEVALDARMLDAKSGRILWYASHGNSGDDYQTVLDFGKIRSMVPLAREVINEMLESL